MFRVRLCFVFFALLASACTSSTTVIGESDTASAVETNDGEITEVDLQAAMATVEPLPTVTPTPKPVTWRVVDDDSGSEADDTDSDTEPATADVESDEQHESTESAPRVKEIADDFAVGRCYPVAGDQAGAAIPCSQSHKAEVVLIGQLPYGPDAEYPDHDVLTDLINEACLPAAKAIGSIGPDSITYPHRPTPRQWQQGDRSYVCFLRFEEPVTASLAGLVEQRQAERAANEAEWEAAQQADREQRVADDQIYVGDCAVNNGITKVPCTEPHGYVAYARTNLASAGGVYPGVGFIGAQAQEFCDREHKAADLSGDIYARYPARWEWEDYGIHTVVCLEAVS